MSFHKLPDEPAPEAAIAVGLHKLEGLIRHARASQNRELEELCKQVLDAEHSGSANSEDVITTPRAMSNISVSNHSSNNSNGMRSNQSIRLSGAPVLRAYSGSVTSRRQSWGNSSISTRTYRTTMWGVKQEDHDYENVFDEDIIRAPIVDMCIIYKGELVPEGFYRISHSISGKKASLNAGTSGQQMYLCIQKDVDVKKQPITALCVILPDRFETVPPGFLVVRRQSQPCDINASTGGDRVYLCYKKGGSNPIVDVQPIYPSRREQCPPSFSLISKTPLSNTADLNSTSGAPPIFLSYRQHFVNVEALSNDVISNPEAGRRSVSETSLQNKSDDDVVHSPQDHKDVTAAIPRLLERSGSNDSLASEVEHKRSMHSPRSTTQEQQTFPNEFSHEDIDELESVASNWESLKRLKFDEVIVTPAGVVCNARCRAVLKPLLVALYIRQGDAFSYSLGALESLLQETNFFAPDCLAVAPIGFKTMLDLTIECLCDRMDCVIEEDFENIMKLLRLVLKKTKGLLSFISLQRIFRTIIFACSCMSTRGSWLRQNEDFPFRKGEAGFINYRTLQDLCTFTLSRVELVPLAKTLPNFPISTPKHNERPKHGPIHVIQTPPQAPRSSTESSRLVEDVLNAFLSDIIDTVEVSRVTEVALVAISKHSSTTTSENFWTDMGNISRTLFESLQHQGAFVLLSALCKVAGSGIRSTSTGEPIARDLGNKLVSLQALNDFLNAAGPQVRKSKIFGYQVRRLIVPCILGNVPYAMFEKRIYAKLLKIITTLWRGYRVHVKLEMAILCDHLILKVLKAGAHQVRPHQRQVVMDELTSWFEAPQNLVELFLNFDMDRKLVSNIFASVCEAVSGLAEAYMTMIGVLPNSSAPVLEEYEQKESMHRKALTCSTQIAKSIMDASGHAHLLFMDQVSQDSIVQQETPPAPTSLDSRHRRSRSGSVKFRRDVHKHNEGLLAQALKIFREKSLKKAIQFLVANNFMSDTPHEVASFLRLYNHLLDPGAIGDFLGEGGTPVDEHYWAQIRFRYTRAISFTEMSLENALRHFFTSAGFRCPGEAQKIDRLISAFANCYFEDNKGTPSCPFTNPETPYVLSYAIIMLNTDLHKANLGSKKKIHRMTKEEFVNNFRGVDAECRDLGTEYPSNLYESIKARPIELALNEEKVKHDGDENKIDELSEQTATVQFVKEVSLSVKQAEELLRGMSPFSSRFLQIGSDTQISKDLMRYIFEAIWFHFHGIVDTLLTAVDVDLHATTICLDLLRDMLSAAMFLDLQLERTAFATQLARFKYLKEASESGNNPSQVSSYIAMGRHKSEPWFQRIESASNETALDAVQELHTMIETLKDKLQRTVELQELKQVAARIEKRANLVQGSRTFLKEGDLQKRCRSGKLILYRFFLFSDQLMYCHQSLRGEFRVHEQLILSVMKVVEMPQDTTNRSFTLFHPKKSFEIVAETPQLRFEWMTAIQKAIAGTQKRRTVERRLSLIPRLQETFGQVFVEEPETPEDEEGRPALMNRITDLDGLNPTPQEVDWTLQRPAPGAESEDSSEREEEDEPPPAQDATTRSTEPSILEWKAAASNALSIDVPPPPSAATADAPDSVAPALTPFIVMDGNTGEAFPVDAQSTHSGPLMVEDHRIAMYRESLETLTDKEVRALFVKGLTYWMRTLDDNAGVEISDDMKLTLYGLYKQAKSGPPVPEEPSPSTGDPEQDRIRDAKMAAWHRFSNLNKNQARKAFLVNLTEAHSDWSST